MYRYVYIYAYIYIQIYTTKQAQGNTHALIHVWMCEYVRFKHIYVDICTRIYESSTHSENKTTAYILLEDAVWS